MYQYNPSSFVLDPNRDGIANALWKAAVGTPGVNGSYPDITFRFNTAEGLVRTDLIYARLEFSCVFPLTGVQTPTNLNNDLEFGFKNASLGDKGKMSVLVDKSDNCAYFRVYDRSGTIKLNQAIAWKTAWNGVSSVWVIFWVNDRVVLRVNGEVVAEYRSSDNVNTTSPVNVQGNVGFLPLNPFVIAVGNDNFDLDYIAVTEAKNSSIMLV